MILGMPSALKRILADLRSRWTMPARWAASIAMTSGTIHSAACFGRQRRSPQPIGQATAFEQLECDVGRAVVFADVVDLQNIGVAKRWRRLPPRS